MKSKIIQIGPADLMTDQIRFTLLKNLKMMCVIILYVPTHYYTMPECHVRNGKIM